MNPQAASGDGAVHLAAARRLVLKVGSRVLCDEAGALDETVFVALADALARLVGEGREVVLVSSGAVAAGAALSSPALGRQARAALGQPSLMVRYERAFAAHGVSVAQLLLTHDDLRHRARFLHARRVIGELLAAGVVPIINENDSIAIEELGFGDNDQLAAQLAAAVDADALVLWTEVDGLYEADPRTDPHARRYRTVRPDDEEALARAGGADRDGLGRGGMRSKVLAARAAAALGVPTLIGRGRAPLALVDWLQGDGLGDPPGTLMLAADDARALRGKRRWFATVGRPRGVVTVDAGAAEAMRSRGSSLLPVGVVAIEGEFEVGHMVEVVDADGALVGRGLVRYDAQTARQLLGLDSAGIQAALGWIPAAELVHRDDLIVEGPR